jgi:putative hydrolase of the HAD superfamily
MQENSIHSGALVPDRAKLTTLVFDFGRVITRDQDPVLAAEIAAILGAGKDEFSRAYFGERNRYDRDSIGSLEYWTRIASKLGRALSASDIARLVDMDLTSWFVINAETTDLIAALRPKVARMVLLSNIPEDGSRKLRGGGYPWLAHFDELVLSCEHKVIKPEAAIYDICIRAAARPAGDCMLIDDIAANIEGARAAGMHGHLFRDAASLARALDSGFILSR